MGSHLQNIRAKWTGGVAQAIVYLLHKCLLCKYEALSLKPSPTPNKKNHKFDVEQVPGQPGLYNETPVLTNKQAIT
jgi:hypothetical protein